MNKKVMIAIIAIALVVCVSIAAVVGISASKKNAASDDGDQSISLDVTREDTASSNEQSQVDVADDSQKENAVEAEPVIEHVDSVQVVTIPEAISIGDGNPDEFYANSDFQDVAPVDIHSFSREDIPTKYDSRNVDGISYITGVEDQGYCYLCWTFASLGAIESDLLLHNPDLSRETLDLSEKHLAYSNMHKATGSVNGYIDGDYREFVNADNEENAWIFEHDTNYIATGGVADCCISLLTAWKGPVTEKGNDAFKSIYGVKFLFKDNSDAPSDIFTSEYHVQNVSEIPASYANNTLIKQMIMEHGSVTAGVYADDRFWKGHNSTLYADFAGKEVPTANHEVLIVGWDDEYSKDNFAIAPEADGAWICKNSWGEASGIGGYFYLSYYDQTTGRNNVAAYSSAVPGQPDYYDNNYQAAGFLTNMVSTLEDDKNYVTAFSPSTNTYGMLYKAAGDENLEAIGLMGLETYQQYQFDIYVNPAKEGDDISFSDLNDADISLKGAAISGGYHTYELPKEIILNKDDEFLVLIRPVTSGRLIYEAACDLVSEPNYDEWNNLTGNIHNSYQASGCSYYVKDDGTGVTRQDDKDFFVKAYTVNR